MVNLADIIIDVAASSVSGLLSDDATLWLRLDRRNTVSLEVISLQTDFLLHRF